MRYNTQDLLKFPQEIARFQSRLMVDAVTGCHVMANRKKRARFVLNSVERNRTGLPKQIGARRLAYILEYGPIPESRRLYPLCGNRHCINPKHMWMRKS
jgi:hypothetical protein